MPNKNLDEVYIFHLEKAYKQFKKFKTDYMKKAGIDITSDQWILLKGISEQEGCSQRELAKRCFKEPASVTRILDILEKKGWVERQHVQNNRRVYELHTTKSGKALIKKMIPIAVKIRAIGVEGFSEREITKFNKVSIKMFDNFS